MSAVTVIIVTWNSCKFLSECLSHLEAQTILPSRIILVDNASSDDTLAILEAFPNLSLLRMGTNLGFAAGNNHALMECDTEFVALLNPDAFPAPDWLERLLAAAKKYPDFVAFGSRQLCHSSPDILDGIGDCCHISGLVWRARHGARQQEKDLTPQEIFSPCAAGALYRRKALMEVGAFDENFFCYVEDVDLGFRLRLAGYNARYVPDAVIHHVGSVSSGGKHSDFAIYYGHRNLVWTFIKNMPGFLFWLLLPLHLALNIISIIWYSVRGRGKTILKAKKDAFSDFPRLWKQRRNIQANRVVSSSQLWKALDKIFRNKFIF